MRANCETSSLHRSALYLYSAKVGFEGEKCGLGIENRYSNWFRSRKILLKATSFIKSAFRYTFGHSIFPVSRFRIPIRSILVPGRVKSCHCKVVVFMFCFWRSTYYVIWLFYYRLPHMSNKVKWKKMA